MSPFVLLHQARGRADAAAEAVGQQVLKMDQRGQSRRDAPGACRSTPLDAATGEQSILVTVAMMGGLGSLRRPPAQRGAFSLPPGPRLRRGR
jgi:hypothetical protein